jgi:hypothetical protein
MLSMTSMKSKDTYIKLKAMFFINNYALQFIVTLSLTKLTPFFFVFLYRGFKKNGGLFIQDCPIMGRVW